MKLILDEMKRSIEGPPPDMKLGRELILREYDHYARKMGFASYEDFRAFWAIHSRDTK